MIPVQIADHQAEAIALLTDKWREKPVVSGILRALTGPMSTLEGATWDVLNQRVLGVASGVWLDVIGRIVGEPRRGRVDDRYVKALRARIRVNRSKGRTLDLLEVAKLLDAAATYLDYTKLAWEVEIYGTDYGGDFAEMLAQARAITTYGVLLTSTLPDAQVFQFASTTVGSPTANKKFGSVY